MYVTRLMQVTEQSLASTDSDILCRLTRIPGIPDQLRKEIIVFKQNFVDSTNLILNLKKQLSTNIAKYREKSKNCTVHKAQIQNLQVTLEKVLLEIEDLRFSSADVLRIQDKIEEQQKIIDQVSHLLEECASQKEKAETNSKIKIQEIARTKHSQNDVNERLSQQWDKHSELTRKLGDHETQAQQLKNSSEETQRAISTMEANAEEWRRKMNATEGHLDDEIAKLQKEITNVESQINDISSMKNEAIASYQQMIANLNTEMDQDNERIKNQVRDIGSLKAQIEQTVETTQSLKESAATATEQLGEKKKVLAELMGELAQRMSLPETQTKEIATLELENRELKKRKQELQNMWQKSIDEVEVLADKISRAKISKYDPIAQEAAIRERILRDSAIRVQEIVESAMKSLSCVLCNKVLNDPVTLVPCGHCVCHSHKFQHMDGPMCPKCGERAARAFVDNSLSVVLSKFIYIKDVVDMLSK